MGGKTIKYPSRRKYTPKIKNISNDKEIISEEEHKKRIELLKNLGLIKE